jgi:hypothetical protein
VPAAAALAVLLLCACSKPKPPETDRPPEPRADAPQADASQADADAGDDADTDATLAADGSDATELRDTIRQPIDRARAVQGEVDAGAAKQRADVDAQAGY